MEADIKIIRAGIVGGAGYTGGELLRLLLRHPQVQISFAHSNSNAGKNITQIHADLIGESDLIFTDTISPEIDVLFLCVGHGEAAAFLASNDIAAHIRIIDLSQDHRLHQNGVRPTFAGRPFVYGLPELNREAIRGATHIANPGCFATAIQLGLLPLAAAGLLKQVYITGITGSTGAGQSLTTSSHFSWRSNNIQAYKTLTHQHLGEIAQSLQQLQPSYRSTGADENEQLSFVPWRGDFTRGIFVSAQLQVDGELEYLQQLYKEYYKDHPFTVVSENPIFLKQVVNTNKCVLQLEKSGKQLVVHAAIDNLLKGASGQAMQNMNLLFGIDECAGLQLKANYF